MCCRVIFLQELFSRFCTLVRSGTPNCSSHPLFCSPIPQLCFSISLLFTSQRLWSPRARYASQTFYCLVNYIHPFLQQSFIYQRLYGLLPSRIFFTITSYKIGKILPQRLDHIQSLLNLHPAILYSVLVFLLWSSMYALKTGVFGCYYTQPNKFWSDSLHLCFLICNIQIFLGFCILYPFIINLLNIVAQLFRRVIQQLSTSGSVLFLKNYLSKLGVRRVYLWICFVFFFNFKFNSYSVFSLLLFSMGVRRIKKHAPQLFHLSLQTCPRFKKIICFNLLAANLSQC